MDKKIAHDSVAVRRLKWDSKATWIMYISVLYIRVAGFVAILFTIYRLKTYSFDHNTGIRLFQSEIISCGHIFIRNNCELPYFLQNLL